MSSPTAAELAPVLAWVRAETGLDFEGGHRTRMAATLQRAWAASGAGSHEEYLDVLRSTPEAFVDLAERLTIGESYFFREPAHFALLRDRIVPAHQDLHGGPLRIWSAGCAGGEEPHSVAIVLDEIGALDHAVIVATDLSERALDRAREGLYGHWSLRRCDDEQRRRWFHPHGPRWRVDDRYRAAVTWRTSGLLDGPPGRGFHVVLCRNVLIYLSSDALVQVADSLHDALAPGGWLLVGASDPMLDHAGLELVVGEHGVAYRRADPRRSAAPAPRPGPKAAGSAPAPTKVLERRARAARRGPSSPRPAAVQRAPSATPPDAPVGDAQARLDAAVAHLDGGRYDDAAVEAAAARYLDPGLVGAHLLLAHACDVRGDHHRAARSYREALALLVTLAPDALVTPVDEPAARLVAAVQGQLERTEPTR